MNTLLRFIEATGLNSQTIESLPASEVDHLLSMVFFFFLWTYAGKMVNTSQQHFPVFSAIYSDTYLRRNIHSTCSRIMSLKNREEFSCEAQVTSPRARQKKQAASRSGDRRKRRRCFFEAGEFGDSNPVALQRTVWWFLSLHFGFRARDESDEDDWLNAATLNLKLNTIFHSNLFLIQSLWCASKFSAWDRRNPFVSFKNKPQLLRFSSNSATNRSWSLSYNQHDYM